MFWLAISEPRSEIARIIVRDVYRKTVETAFGRSLICGLMGPRQCGKSTLARGIAATVPSHYFDLESPRDQLRLHNPELTLERLLGISARTAKA